VPLAQSSFWGPMALAIMGGLVAATILTMTFLPALYALAFRVPTPARAQVLHTRPAEELAAGLTSPMLTPGQ
jgi:Cu/Ag efflux pump CusA